MWEYERGVETTAAPEAVWRLWSDVEGWPRWNADIERIALSGPFAEGSEITMTPRGQETVHLRLTAVREGEAFVDEASIGGAVISTTHELRAAGTGRTRVVYRMEITGPAAATIGPELGPAITADFPETIGALVALAESGVGPTESPAAA
jgi:uncharacterized protein YndB with AHSA1/START domain